MSFSNFAQYRWKGASIWKKNHISERLYRKMPQFCTEVSLSETSLWQKFQVKTRYRGKGRGSISTGIGPLLKLFLPYPKLSHPMSSFRKLSNHARKFHFPHRIALKSSLSRLHCFSFRNAFSSFRHSLTK